MSTRSATIFKQTTYWGEQAETEEVLRFYLHCDGYPEGNGLELAKAVVNADRWGVAPDYWASGLLGFFLTAGIGIELEPRECAHGDLEFIYVVEGIVDRRWGRKSDGTLPVTISIFEARPSYREALAREPIFSGTAYEYIEKFGGEQ